MIWFDAALEYAADDELLRRCVAMLLGLGTGGVEVVRNIGKSRDAPATCLVGGGSQGAYSQIVTLHLSPASRQPDAVESGMRLARLLGRSLLLANDATADPYSFLLASRAGTLSTVSVDRKELDEHNRYAILTRENP
ncbi:hypothetical protein [Mesorhizobium sp. B2-3-4]|uniref:hypothetical protein n=1 Tax=Mesorhizobium sp. B2-3-4 TaxID=2589959 RepID=UPI00112C9CB8|nr:hypothetical protein [Mesorhizobium sp. B2-3-4]TPM34246.1 hypothetical protein FJ967_22685 [Mesorhizobium sp. B2-3-4]